jgi:PAS domain S-box-containing protein
MSYRATLPELIVLLVLLFASVPSQASQVQDASAPKSIRVVLDDNYPPYIFRGSDGRMQGILKDLWTLWQQRTGIAVDFQPMEWGKAKAAMESGRADVIDTIFDTPERRKIYDFSRPYAKIEVPVFFSREISGITDAASLKGFTVGVKSGDACIDFLKTHGINMLRYYPSYAAEVHAAVAHHILVLCIDKPPAIYLFNQANAADQFRYSSPLYTGKFHWAVARGRADLKQLVEAGFAKITPGEREAIETRWLGQRLEDENWTEWVRYGGYVLFAVLLAIVVLFTWNRTLRRLVRTRTSELSATILELSHSEQRFHNLFEMSQIGMAITSTEHAWLNVNPSLCKMFGYEKDELTGKTWSEMTHPEDLEPDMNQFERLISGEIERYSMNKRFFHRNGNVINVFLTVFCQRRPDQSVEYIMKTLENITERKLAESRVQRLTQIYAALSQCNQAIMRSTSEADLLPIICRDAVNFGGMKMAWIGMVDESGKFIRPVASSGLGTEYLEGIEISLEPDSPTAGGPMYTVIHEKRPYWVQDFQLDPATAPWHERAAGYHWGASASLPLYRKGAVVGVFGLYSGEANAFDEPMKDLLVEMASDISFALDNMDNAAERRRIEHALKDSEERYRKVFQSSPDAINITRLSDGMYLDVNSGFENMIGYRRDEAIGKTSLELNIWRNPEDRRRLVDSLIRTGVCDNLEADFNARNGTVIKGLMSGVIINIKGEVCIITITRDITRAKIAEQKVLESESLLRIAGQLARVGAWKVEHPWDRVLWSDTVCDIHEVPHGTLPSVEESIRFFAPGSFDRIRNAIAYCIRDGTPYDEDDLELVTAKGHYLRVHAIGYAIRDHSGAITAIQGALVDITERYQAAADLRELNARLLDLFESMSDGFIAFDADMNCTYLNTRGGEMLGRKPADLVGKSYWREYPEAKGTPFGKAYRRALKSRATIIIEDNFAPFDLWFENRIYPSREGLSVFFTDITGRKQAESEREHLLTQLRNLSRRLVDAQEEERKHLAHTLHDDIGQSLTAIKVYASSITSYGERQDFGQVRQSAEQISHISTGLLKTVRGKLRDLTPGFLVELGLKGALRHLCASWENSGAIACNLKISGAVDKLPGDLQLQLYRIIQEGLTNVARHADASTASIKLAAGKRGLRLDVADDGCGFNFSAIQPGMGLVGMRERTFAMGGQFELQSAPGAGTQIRIHFQFDPVQRVDSDQRGLF